ncbi:MAG TPA: succinyl-diaminopimelate desuccinylase [Acidimicrobiia bacterium]|jgi:succinyl-diaminopimelate desuccinylase
MTSLGETLADLVATHSVTGNEGRLCTAIAERFLPLFTMDKVQRIGNSLVVGAQTGRPLISLYGHIDTVPEQEGNGASRVEDGRMYGLGTSDMKSGVAVMIHLLEDDTVRSGRYDVVGVFYDKEEGPSVENGLEEVLDRAPWLSESELAIVLEPTDLQIELGCNGVINADVTFHGRSAHSARPWLGENAVTKAGEWLTEMHGLEPVPAVVGGLEYREVFSVTMAQGGIANNVLPPSFTVNLNYRFPPLYSLAEAEARLRRVAMAADEIVVKDRAPAGSIPESNPHLARLEDIARTSRAAKQGWTDVARLTARGIPAVNYGPGETAQAHQVTESVPIVNLDRAYSVLRQLLAT